MRFMYRPFSDLWRSSGGGWITVLGVFFVFLTFTLPLFSLTLPWKFQWLWTLQLEDDVLVKENTEKDNVAIHELINRMRAGAPPETWREPALKVGGLELRERDLRGANLRRAKLPNAILTEINLQGADLTRAKLPWAELERVQMQEATLTEAILYEVKLGDIDLSGSKAENINLTGAEMIGVLLNNAKWRGARLDDAVLDSFRATDTDLTNASLKNADATSAHLNGVLLNNATLRGTILEGASLERTDLSLAKMAAVVLARAHMEKASLDSADLRGATLRAAVFDDTRFRNANLTGADLRETEPRRANLKGAGLGLADLRGAKLLMPPLTTLERKNLGASPQDWSSIEERPCRTRKENKEDEFCLEQWKSRIPQEHPCLMTKAWGPCLGEKDLAEYDKYLADFLADLACEDESLARPVIRRAESIRKDEPQRPITTLLHERLTMQDCPAWNELSAKTRESFERIR
uniref:Uncharacterized protein YjbI, contains pentapeptide repeats n=1 Tax=Candidatus Kentrum sp. LPFa TaxID=2126335 RepID=A0A450WCY5_9GAMM|nr:MAG: Uncharacterized protein YjbI, contains pentapeptide repeats [Candidatus Kentron sp. LPFa]